MREALRYRPVVARTAGCAEAKGRSPSISMGSFALESVELVELVTEIKGQHAAHALSLRADTELSLAYALCPLLPLAGEGQGMRETLRYRPVVARTLRCAEAKGRSASIQTESISFEPVEPVEPVELVTNIKGQLAAQSSSLCDAKELSLAYASESPFLDGQEKVTQKKAAPQRRLPGILPSRYVLGARWSAGAHPCAFADWPHPCGHPSG